MGGVVLVLCQLVDSAWGNMFWLVGAGGHVSCAMMGRILLVCGAVGASRAMVLEHLDRRGPSWRVVRLFGVHHDLIGLSRRGGQRERRGAWRAP